MLEAFVGSLEVHWRLRGCLVVIFVASLTPSATSTAPGGIVNLRAPDFARPIQRAGARTPSVMPDVEEDNRTTPPSDDAEAPVDEKIAPNTESPGIIRKPRDIAPESIPDPPKKLPGARTPLSQSELEKLLKGAVPTSLSTTVPRPSEGEAAVFEPIDTRQPVTKFDLNYVPYSAIGQIRAQYARGVTLVGTGFLVAPGLVVTAAHVLDSPTYGPAPLITFVPGCTAGGEHPLAVAQTVDRSSYRVSSRWQRGSRAIAADFGVIALPITSWQCGSLVLRAIEPEFFTRNINAGTSRFILAGYPVEKRDQQWLGRGSFWSAVKSRLDHLIDTSPGQSGAPIVAVVADGQSSEKIPMVVGIHSRSAAGDRFAYNQARRVDSELIVEIRRLATEVQRQF